MVYGIATLKAVSRVADTTTARKRRLFDRIAVIAVIAEFGHDL